MARLRWRIEVEIRWHKDIPVYLDNPIHRNLTGRDRVDYAKNKRIAADLVKTLFPPDEET
jgi:hypothetical protein